MRSILGEYGKIIVCAIMVLSIFGYCFTLRNDSVAASLPSPTVTVKSDDSFALVDDVSKRPYPTITIPKEDCKLQIRKTYNLMSPTKFHVSATNADGTALSYKVVKLVLPDGSVLEKEAAEVGAYSVATNQTGTMQVTYETQETYNGRELKTQKTFQFVID